LSFLWGVWNMTYQDLLHRIANKEYATAGCTLKEFILAANMVDWVEENYSDENKFSKYEDDTLHYLIELHPAAYAFFVQAFQDTYDQAEEMVVNPGAVAGLAESCGYPLKTKNPSIKKLKSFYDFIQSCEDQIIKEDVKISYTQMGDGPDVLEQEYESKKKQRELMQ
jgi:hypothetical protein